MTRTLNHVAIGFVLGSVILWMLDRAFVSLEPLWRELLKP